MISDVCLTSHAMRFVVRAGSELQYLQQGPGQRRSLRGTRGRAWRCRCRGPDGADGGPTGSSARPTSAPEQPGAPASACPIPTPRRPCCLQGDTQTLVSTIIATIQLNGTSNSVTATKCYTNYSENDWHHLTLVGKGWFCECGSAGFTPMASRATFQCESVPYHSSWPGSGCPSWMPWRRPRL